MSQPAKAQEPSMEEILASIRRIIADDDASRGPADAGTAKPAAPTPRPNGPAPKPSPLPPAAAVARQAEIDAAMAELGPPPSRNAPAEPASVLDLTEAMAAPSDPAPAFRTIDPQSDVIFGDADSAPPAPLAAAAPARSQPEFGERTLISASTSAAVDSAFNTLAQTVLVQNARTLEDLVKEMLRPMLKSWLDDNLPGLVERLVRAEIERVSRGRT
jgi:cell pole-organizing protein PopZ